MSETLEFGIVYEVRGNAGAALKDIANSMRMVTSEAIRMKHAMGGAGGGSGGGGGGGMFGAASSGARGLASSVNLSTLALNDSIRALEGWGTAAAEAMAKAAGKGIKAAITVEESNARLKFATGKIGVAYDPVLQKIDDIALKSVLTRNALQDMFSTLAIQKINIFDAALDKLSVTASDGSKRTVDAMEVMQDAVSFSGKDVARVMFSIKEAVSEQMIRPGRLLADDLNLSRKELVVWNKELKAASNNQDAFNRLMALMAERVGGVTHSLGGTLAFTLKLVEDWVDRLSTTLFAGSLQPIRQLILDIGDYIVALTKSGNLDAVAAEITSIVVDFIALARAAGHVAKSFVEFVRTHPHLVRIAVQVAAVSYGLSKVLSALGGVGALIFNLRNLFSILGPGMLAFVIPAMKAVAIFAALAGLATVFAKIAVGGDSIADTWGRVWQVVQGVWQAFSNMNWENGITFIDEKNAAALEKSGLLETVIDISRWIFRMKSAAMGFWETIKIYWPMIKEIGTQIFDTISASLEHTMGNMNKILKSMGIDLKAAPDSAVSGWVKFGNMVGEIIAGVMIVVGELILLITKMTAEINKMMSDFAGSGLSKLIDFMMKPKMYNSGMDMLSGKLNPEYVKWEQEQARRASEEPVQAQPSALAAMGTLNFTEEQKQKLLRKYPNMTDAERARVGIPSLSATKASSMANGASNTTAVSSKSLPTLQDMQSQVAVAAAAAAAAAIDPKAIEDASFRGTKAGAQAAKLTAHVAVDELGSKISGWVQKRAEDSY